MPARSRRRPAPTEVQSSKFEVRTLHVLALLLVAGITAYWPVLTLPGGWLWDDDGHVTSSVLQSTSGLWRIWFDLGATQQYYPLTHTVFWIQSHLFGTDSPAAYHWVALLLHTTSAFLAFLILRSLAVPGALLAAALFLIHPIQVESVAWTSELKNTLSCVFYLAAAHAYLRFDDRRGAGAFVRAVLFLALALLSKSVTATLPAVLLVILWWKRGSLHWTRDVLPLLPLVAMSVGAGALTVWFERTNIGASGPEFQFTFVERTLIAGRALWFYATSLLWPVSFSFNYPRWQVNHLLAWQYLFPAAVIIALAALWRWRGAFAGVLVFCFAVAPAIGFVNVYPFRFSFVADHFQYHASVALLAVAASALALGAARLQLSRVVSSVAAAILIVTLGVMTNLSARKFVDGATLYRATIAENPASWFAHNNLAALIVTRQASDDLRTAVTHAREALRIRPGYAEARYNLAIALDDLGDLDAAITEYRALLNQFAQEPFLQSKRAGTSRRLGLALAQSGRPGEAVPHLREAAALDPANAEPLTNLGAALLSLGEPLEAQRVLEEAIRRDPRADAAYYNLGNTYLIQRRYDDATRAFEQVLRLRPGDAQAQAALTRARQLAGR